MLAWLGISSEGVGDSDEEEEQRNLAAHKVLMKTLSEYELSNTPKVDGVWCYDGQKKAVSGALCLTGHHMILYADETTSGEIWIQYKNIDAIEKRFGVDKGTLVLKCKDLKQIQLTIPGVEDATNVAYTAETLSSITNPSLYFPYFYRPKFKIDDNGWDLYKIEEHFAKLSGQSERWRLSEVNADFGICRSYPSVVIVPKEIDDHSLQKSARFRQGGRFPLLSYFHKNGAAILRSSQPLVSTGNRRCKDDEKLINSMLGPSHRGYILDIRSVQTAVQAKTKGGGYEMEHHYPRWKRIHMNLHSYYVQQESLIRIVEASNDKSGNMDRWMSKLESSDWMGYIKKSLDASCLVAQCIDKEEWSVLVHGAEGYDSTLTVTSLAQIILDPECRTIRGFLSLIHREWLRGGHPFTERSAHGPYSNTKQRGEGPVFSIFLECVFQLLCQFNLSFEFNSKLLVDLRMHSYASHFGTFLHNNMHERTRGKVFTKTVSLWSYILSPSVFPKYVNSLYRRQKNVIWPSVAPQSLEFWEELYTPHLSPRDGIFERVRSLEAERFKLEVLVMKLSKWVGSIPVNEAEDANAAKALKKVPPGVSPKKISPQSYAVAGTDEHEKMDHLCDRRVTVSNGPITGITPQTCAVDEVPAESISEGYSQFYVPRPRDYAVGDISNGTPQPNLLDDLMESVDPTPILLSPNSPSSPETTTEKNSEDLTNPNLIDLDDLAIDSDDSS